MTESERIDWRAGGALALAAAVTLAAGARAFDHAPVPVSTLMLLVGAVVAALVIVARCDMPTAPRVVAMAAMILVTIACAVRSDMASGGAAGRIVAVMPGDERATSAGTNDSAPGETRDAGPAPASGAAVMLAGDDRAARWAADAGAALSGSVAGGVAGATAWTITGDLAADDPEAAPIAATARWRIAGNGGSIPCGTIAIRATGEAALIDALAAAFTVAVRRSALAGRVACG